MSLKYFTIEERLNANAWDVDIHRPHIKIKDPDMCRKCEKKPCTYMCPAKCYVQQGDIIVLSTEACVECGRMSTRQHRVELSEVWHGNLVPLHLGL